MPHINRIRVNNVKYNFGTQFYDDFLMRFTCKNTIYDLANGGGKSVLMLLLLQNLIPNCTLDEKQPIEKLFRTEGGSNVIHSMIEWRLSDVHVKNNYKYMLTGFCARKARDNASDVNGSEENNGIEIKNTAAIEYFNYVVFYREFNDNDIKNFPLNKGKERITYNGLKNYLKELGQKDFSLEVKVFERKGDYQRFITNYGLYESEWEIIRGINKTEGHVRAYFEGNYKTTRKVVEDLLIEEIIQKSFNNHTEMDSNDDDMAKTLLDIKDKLIELAGRKDEINNYDRQVELIESFAKRVQNVKQLYFGREDLNNQITKAFNSLRHSEKTNEEKLEQANNDKEDINSQANMEKKLIESAKVQEILIKSKHLEEKLTEVINKIEEAQSKINTGNTELLLKESGNDYLDYLYYRAERDEMREIVDNVLKDKTEVIKELQMLISNKKARDDVRIESLTKEADDIQVIIDKESEINDVNGQKERELDRESAILINRLLEYQSEEENLNETIIKLKNEAGLLMPSDAAGELSAALMKKQGIDSEIDRINQEEINAKDRLNTNEMDIHDFDNLLLNIDESYDTEMEFHEKALDYRKRVAGLKEIYGENNLEDLIKVIKNKHIMTELRLSELNNILSETGKQIEGYNQGRPIRCSKEYYEVFDYINKYHGDIAIEGMDYLSQKSAEEQALLLENIPILPYSIIIKENFLSLITDERLKDINTQGSPVALVELDAVKRNEPLIGDGRIKFVMSDMDVFVNEEVARKQLLRIQNIWDSSNAELRRVIENEKIISNDYDFLRKYLDYYMDRIAENESKIETFRIKRREYNAGIESIKADNIDIMNSIDNMESKKSELMNSLAELQHRANVLSEIKEKFQKTMQLSQKMQEIEERKLIAAKEHKELKAIIEASVRLTASRCKNRDNILDLINKIKNDWENIYRSYYKEGSYDTFDMSDEELESKLKGMIKSLKDETTDLNDKQKLIDNYDIAMEKSLQAIDYKGLQVLEIKKAYDNHQISRIETAELTEIKKQIDEWRKYERELSIDEKHIRSEKDKLDGMAVQASSAIIEKYGSYEQTNIDENALISYVKDHQTILQGFENKMNEIEQRIKEQEQNKIELIGMKKDIDRIIISAGIDPELSDDIFDSSVNLSDKFVEISGRFDKFQKESNRRREELLSDKQMLVDTLKMLNATELADEIARNINMPQNGIETDELINILADINSCLALEKERVGKSIEDMERIKDNFENQCIQTCLNIKTEIDRLPNLSKIFMEGESISIIGLTIPYVKEEMYKPLMSKYIDEIVSISEDMKNQNERLRYIKNQLAWKRLFSVIVTDMNGIRLNLYKRERIKEQSRYLKYEEAVGSTGQSQGIYIQFLVAIINYISSINSKNSECSRLRKVVFIDNPFGAAKDVYIWEPIFKLLKTNNVQLIVPARGTTPAITGRFDVNYILGQKLIDGRQQTVVVDYSSNVENDKMEYTKLSYEQTALF